MAHAVDFVPHSFNQMDDSCGGWNLESGRRREKNLGPSKLKLQKKTRSNLTNANQYSVTRHHPKKKLQIDQEFKYDY